MSEVLLSGIDTEGSKRNLSGSRFGKLTAQLLIEGSKPPRWLCLCDCGKTTESLAYTLTRGEAKSCGCSRKSKEFRAKISAANTKHGFFGSKIYAVWAGLKDRCENPKSKSWKDYGGRGIKVCSEWSESFEAFLRDVGEHPGDGFSLDREDTNGNYEKGNCRWATAKEQANNRRTNKHYTYKGETKTLTQWAEAYGLNVTTLFDRLKARNDDINLALEFKCKRQNMLLTYNNETKTADEWAKSLGLTSAGLRKRLRRHSLEVAITTPRR